MTVEERIGCNVCGDTGLVPSVQQPGKPGLGPSLRFWPCGCGVPSRASYRSRKGRPLRTFQERFGPNWPWRLEWVHALESDPARRAYSYLQYVACVQYPAVFARWRAERPDARTPKPGNLGPALAAAVPSKGAA